MANGRCRLDDWHTALWVETVMCQRAHARTANDREGGRDRLDRLFTQPSNTQLDTGASSGEVWSKGLLFSETDSPITTRLRKIDGGGPDLFAFLSIGFANKAFGQQETPPVG